QVDVHSGAVTTDGTTGVFVSATTGKLTETATNTSAGTTGAVADKFSTDFAGKAGGGTAMIGGYNWTTTGPVDATGNGTYTAKIDGNDISVTITGAAAGTGGTMSVTGGSLFMDEAAFAAGTTTFTTHSDNEKA